MTDLREAIARAIVSAGYNPATAPAIADAVLAILPDAEELAEALDECQNILGEIPAPMSAPLWFSMCSAMKRANAALANYRKGTGREG